MMTDNEFTAPPPSESSETQEHAPEVQRKPLFGTIFWGVVLLVFAAVMVVLAMPSVAVEPAVLAIGALLIVGVLLMITGIAAWLQTTRSAANARRN